MDIKKLYDLKFDSDIEMYKYFIDKVKSEIDEIQIGTLLSVLYMKNPELFKINTLLLIKECTFNKFLCFIIMHNIIYKEDKFFIQVLLTQMCVDDNIMLGEIKNKEKSNATTYEKYCSNFYKDIAIFLYDNGKRKPFQMYKKYNELIKKNNIINYKQVIVLKQLINLDNPTIEKIYNIKNVENVFSIPFNV